MDFDGIAQDWASSPALTSPLILAQLLDCDMHELSHLRRSVARHAGLAQAVGLIDVLASFQQARQSLANAKEAATRMADIALRLAADAAGVPVMAQAWVARALHAQEAAHLALDQALTGLDKINAAVVLELADTAAAKAIEASEAADRLHMALEKLVRSTQPRPMPGVEPTTMPVKVAEDQGGIQ